MGLKLISEQYRNDILRYNLKTPVDVIAGLVDLSGAAMLKAYEYSLGKDTVVHFNAVQDPGTVLTNAVEPRLHDLKRNLPIPANQDIGTFATVNDYNVKQQPTLDQVSADARKIDLNRDLPLPTNQGIGENAQINDYAVRNAGTIDSIADEQRNLLFKKNRPFDQNDPSENDPMFAGNFGYTYTSLLASIGKLTVIHDLSIPDAFLVSTLATQTPDVSLGILLSSNRYQPQTKEVYDASKVNLLTSNSAAMQFAKAFSAGTYNSIQQQTYEPDQFLNINLGGGSGAMLSSLSSDPTDLLLSGSIPAPLPNDTLMMNINALELNAALQARIQQNIDRETLLRTDLPDLMYNPTVNTDLLTDPSQWFQKDYTISVSSNPIGKAAEFIAMLEGVTLPFAAINYQSEDYSPQCFGNTTPYDNKAKTAFGKFFADLTGKTARNDRDVYFLNHTGDGQKYQLFSLLNMNKYSPNYLADYQSGIFQAGEQFAQFVRGITGFIGVGAGKRPVGDYYIGSKSRNDDPFYLLQDADGDQVYSNEKLTETLKHPVSGTTFDEPGYDEVSQYGSIETDFIWKASGATESVLSTDLKTTQQSNTLGSLRDTSKLSTSKNLRECSILFKTAQLLEKGVNGYNSPIDQTLTKFFDGYTFNARGNATISPIVKDHINRQGERIGYAYFVPGLDATGKRNDAQLYAQAEMCRTWTKTRPYSKISNAIRFNSLIRSEQYSIIDKYNNLNIYPTALNVTSGFNHNTSIDNNARARKYMFSIENLAWRDSSMYTDLPNSEKGANGGRIMWFPPYDIQFTDSTMANWTTHQFLGRPEPIYTYNNTERSGTLSWKIVVDHPTILNVLVQKELAKLTDGEVDEILSAFWAGCVEFDIYELARIWNQFTSSELDYFKRVISGLNLSKPNDQLKPQIAQVLPYKQPATVKANSTNGTVPTSSINLTGLFFENDVPLNPAGHNGTGVYDTPDVQSFKVYFDKYTTLATTDSFDNVEVAKGIDTYTDWMKYNEVIGNNSHDNYFNVSKGEKWSGMVGNVTNVVNDLQNSKYLNYDLTVDLTAYTSPLAPSSAPGTYNSDLAVRRFVSVVKWLVLDVLTKAGSTTLSVYSKDKTTIIDKTNIDGLLNNVTNSFVVYRKNSTADGFDTITFNLKPYKDITPTQAINAIYKNPEKDTNGNMYFVVSAPSEDNSISNQQFCCFESSDNAKNANVTGFDPQQIGSVESKKDRSYADIVCGVLSIVASYSRRVDITVTAKPAPPKPATPQTQQTPATISIPNDLTTNASNITKRTIAQKLLDKFVTEADYFQILQSDSPVVFNSLKEKLKYFMPAFHSTTPEGLNSRLTFLQQCMRPGETITRTNGESCDASNTAFGKPPVCILRIGDLYNTKIVINDLNISYDPLVWDMNPEGIGMQPMLATVQMSFKYIGGSGLRTYVDQLQNALSFNYYANADIYDARTYANTNASEETLVNLETDFFNGNSLDLVPIVAAAEKFTQDTYVNPIPGGTIGFMSKSLQPATPGGIYGAYIANAVTYNSSTVYQPFSVVYFTDSNFYFRKADNPATFVVSGNTLNGSSAPPTNKQYWDQVQWQNYGEEGFRLEYTTNTSSTTQQAAYLSSTYYNSYETHYRDLFNDLYTTYGNMVGTNVKFNTFISQYTTLLQLIANKNYNKALTTTVSSGAITGLTISNITEALDLIDLEPYGTGFTEGVTGLTTTTGSTLYKAFAIDAFNKNYHDFGEFGNLLKNTESSLATQTINPIKLHLYPQDYLYKIGDGKSLVSQAHFIDNNRYNPGNLTGGYNSGSNAEVAGIYIKDYNYYSDNLNSLLTSLKNELRTKISLDIEHFWFYSGNTINTYKDYLTYFERPHRDIFSNYLNTKLDSWFVNTLNILEGDITTLNEANGKFGTLLAGASVITEGYDITVQQDGSKNYYEVIPNSKKLSSQASTLFGYDPYLKYKALSIGSFSGLTFNQVYNIVQNRTSSTDAKLDFLSLGNGSYFFKQISKNNAYRNILNLPTTSGTAYDNYFVESVALSDGTSVVDTTVANFKFGKATIGGATTTGVTINGTHGLNGATGSTVTTKNIPSNDYNKSYPMTYVFEKINYELFDFSNKTLDIMLNDNFMTKDFDLDIKYNNDLEFVTQITPSGGDKLFYVGTKSQLSGTKINYYTYNVSSVSGATTQSAIESINNFIAYTVPSSDELSAAAGNPSTTFTSAQLSGLVDMIFLGFFYTLTDDDKAAIMAQIKTITPTKGISTDPKTKQSQINSRFTKMQSILDKIFASIYTYENAASDKIDPIYTEYNTNADNVINNFNEILTGTASTNEITGTTVAASLIKGTTDDYTVVLRDSSSIKNSAEKNYTFFTNYRKRFNIISTNENPQVVDTTLTGTTLSQYLNGKLNVIL